MSDPRNHGQMIKTHHIQPICYPHECQHTHLTTDAGHRPIFNAVVTD